MVVARVKGMANQTNPPEIKPQTPWRGLAATDDCQYAWSQNTVPDINSCNYQHHRNTTTTLTEVAHNVDNPEDEATGAEEGQIGAALVAHILVGSLPAGDVVKYRLRGAEWVLRVV